MSMSANRLQRSSALVIATSLLFHQAAAINYSAFVSTSCTSYSASTLNNANRFQFQANEHKQDLDVLDDQHSNIDVDNGDGHSIYSLAQNAGPISSSCSLTESQIHRLLTMRLQFKKSRNFDKSDRILEALNDNGVYVQDKRREYRADGRNHFGRQIHYQQRGSTYGMPQEDLVIIAGLVEDRAHAKRTRTFHRSDEITDTLKKKYNVKVNDKKREWYVVGPKRENEGTSTSRDDDSDTNASTSTSAAPALYVPSPLAPPNDPTHTMNNESKTHIQNRLTDRTNARKKKKYKLADEIRDELMAEYSIVIDDRTSEWKVVNMEEGEDGEWDEFAREAKLSQRSAFISKGYEKNDVETIKRLVSEE